MALRQEHEIHTRRFRRNLGVGLTLGAFIIIVFAMTIVKITHGEPMQGDAATAAGQTAQQGSTP